jgi:hypothetical protein
MSSRINDHMTNATPLLTTTTMKYPGLLNWANSVCHNMANDPGRQLSKDQVQTHGRLP